MHKKKSKTIISATQDVQQQKNTCKARKETFKMSKQVQRGASKEKLSHHAKQIGKDSSPIAALPALSRCFFCTL